MIVRLDAIGDALVTVPLTAALRAHGFRVSAVLTSANAQAFAPHALERVHAAGPQAAAAVGACGYDVALIPSEEPEAYALARDAGIPVRVGFDNGLWGKPFKTLWIRSACTRTVFRNASLDAGGLHECEIVFQLARDLLPGVRAPRDAAVLRPLVIEDEPAPDARIAMQITDKWQRLGAPLEDVVRLAQRAAASGGLRAVGSAAESAYCDAFEHASGIAVERFDALPPWKDAIAAARALIAPDSGALHVAGMTGTPSLACYAPHLFERQVTRWKPWAARSHALRMSGDWPTAGAVSLRQLLQE